MHLHREEGAAHHLPHLRIILPLRLVSPAHRHAGGIPPEDNPPGGTPSERTPLGSTPPKHTPPGGAQPEHTPPDATSPEADPPGDIPPACIPPSGTPPETDPPGGTPPGGTPPETDPPGSTPPEGIPLKGNARHSQSRTRWFKPTCAHELGYREGEMPLCGRRACLCRWWRRYGIPSLILLIGLTVYLSIGYGPPPCPPGWEPLGLGDCVRR